MVITIIVIVIVKKFMFMFMYNPHYKRRAIRILIS